MVNETGDAGDDRPPDSDDRDPRDWAELPDDVVTLIADDTAAMLEGHFPTGMFDDDRPDGYELVSTFGDGGSLTSSARDGLSQYVLVRWQWTGRHQPVEEVRRLGASFLSRPTGNAVVIEGLTIVEQREEGLFIRRLVDWLSVYAQLGMVSVGRPVGMANIQVLGFDPSPPIDEPDVAG
jgi:hypothetical protein